MSSAMAWNEAAVTWSREIQSCWLLRCCRAPKTSSEEQLEQRCAELLRDVLQGAPFGVMVSQPWSDFARDMRPPEHPAQRLPSNLACYAGGTLKGGPDAQATTSTSSYALAWGMQRYGGPCWWEPAPLCRL